MAVMFFGQYLVENGIVSRDVLVRAIELQERTNLSFGDTAVAMGLLTTEDAERVNLAQRSEDMRIGDLCVKMGLLTSQQVEAILARQKETHLYIGEALVRVGGLTEDALATHLARFKESQSEYATRTSMIPVELPNHRLLEMIADLTGKMLTRVAHLTYHTEPCIVDGDFTPLNTVVQIDVHGDVGLSYLFGCDHGFRTKIAKAILNSDDVEEEAEEVLADTVMEFANVVCGNVVARAAQQGMSLDIMPPLLVTDLPQRFNSRSVQITYRLPEGDRGVLAVVMSL